MTGSDPASGGVRFFCTNDPASASTGIAGKIRPNRMHMPCTRFHVMSPFAGVSVSPPNAEPLLPTPDANA